MNYLALAWIGLIAFAVIMYVILDGFDLGIAIMSPFFDHTERDLMISTIMPVWDGNETWLVFGGAALYGSFPLAFGTLLPILYIPMIIMVCALLFRGVAFEFRLKSKKSRFIWDWSFFLGSVVAAFVQGLVLGTFVHGFNGALKNIPGSTFHFFSAFSVTCGIALIFGYVLLGATWLIIKTTGSLQEKNFKIAEKVLIIIGIFALTVSIWSPFIDPEVKQRWFNIQYMAYYSLLPAATMVAFVALWWSLRHRKEYRPFWLSIFIFLMCYVGFAISTYPYIVPRTITFTEAAAPRSSLLFMFVGAVILLPILLYYTYHAYRIFRGKVNEPLVY